MIWTADGKARCGELDFEIVGANYKWVSVHLGGTSRLLGESDPMVSEGKLKQWAMSYAQREVARMTRDLEAGR